jgi:cyclophilin family peptidyl-prolyl cis-trans isomerase
MDIHYTLLFSTIGDILQPMKNEFYVFIFVVLVGLAGFLFLSRASQKSQPQSATTENYGTDLPSSSPASESAKMDNTNETLNPEKGLPVKTLKDFEKITATEATITTNKGDITFTLFPDKTPLTVANFLTLVKSGFYNGIKFHRIIPDFMAQVGDPLTKDDSQKEMWGTGGPGYTIEDEFTDLKHDTEGTVSMANTGQPNTGGSQIFITYAATPWLDGHHAVFGKVTKGMDVLKSLVVGDSIIKVTYK